MTRYADCPQAATRLDLSINLMGKLIFGSRSENPVKIPTIATIKQRCAHGHYEWEETWNGILYVSGRLWSSDVCKRLSDVHILGAGLWIAAKASLCSQWKKVSILWTLLDGYRMVFVVKHKSYCKLLWYMASFQRAGRPGIKGESLLRMLARGRRLELPFIRSNGGHLRS